MTDLSVAVLPSLGKSDRTKVLEFIGNQETVERSQSGFCRDCLGKRKNEKKEKKRNEKGNKNKKNANRMVEMEQKSVRQFRIPLACC